MTNPTVQSEYLALNTAPVKVGRHVIIGAGSVLLPGSDIGEGAAIGALSLINGATLAGWTIYAGSPVRNVGPRKRDLLQLERKLVSSSAAEWCL